MSIIKKVKYWNSVIKPHKGYMCGLFVSSLISSFWVLFQALPKSKIVVSLTTFDYKTAVLWIVLSLIFDLTYYICYHINYKCYYKLSEHCSIDIGMQIYDKISTASEHHLAQKSIDRILLTASEHINSCIKFADFITMQCCHLISAIIAIGIVLFYNFYVGAIMLTISVLTIIFHTFLGQKANALAQNISSSKEDVNAVIYNVVEQKELIRSYNLQNQTRNQYLNSITKLTTNYSHRGKIYSIESYWIYGVLYVIITMLSIWLAELTHTSQLSLSVYLIITPYLIEIIDQISNGYELIYRLEEVLVPTSKIKLLLDMPSRSFSIYGSNNSNKLSGNLVFNNVSYVDNNLTKDIPNIHNINISVAPHSVSLFCGDHLCGKKTLFNLLCRTILPTSGTITMDEINIYDFNDNTYKHNFSYTSSSPTFYNESIIANLRYSNCDKQEIFKVCKTLGIDKEILSLPHKYQTNLVKEKNICGIFLVFMLGLARALLTGSEWIAIYKLPRELTTEQEKHIKNLLLNLKSKHSFLIFDSVNNTNDIFDNIWHIKNGKISNVKGEPY